MDEKITISQPDNRHSGIEFCSCIFNGILFEPNRVLLYSNRSLMVDSFPLMLGLPVHFSKSEGIHGYVLLTIWLMLISLTGSFEISFILLNVRWIFGKVNISQFTSSFLRRLFDVFHHVLICGKGNGTSR